MWLGIFWLFCLRFEDRTVPILAFIFPGDRELPVPGGVFPRAARQQLLAVERLRVPERPRGQHRQRHLYLQPHTHRYSNPILTGTTAPQQSHTRRYYSVLSGAAPIHSPILTSFQAHIWDFGNVHSKLPGYPKISFTLCMGTECTNIWSRIWAQTRREKKESNTEQLCFLSVQEHGLRHPLPAGRFHQRRAEQLRAAEELRLSSRDAAEHR